MPRGPQELEVESAPLEEMEASLLQFRVPEGSRLHGVYVTDLRLPDRAEHRGPDRGGVAARIFRANGAGSRGRR